MYCHAIVSRKSVKRIRSAECRLRKILLVANGLGEQCLYNLSLTNNQNDRPEGEPQARDSQIHLYVSFVEEA